jgi:cysteine desulfuration protein SufE
VVQALTGNEGAPEPRPFFTRVESLRGAGALLIAAYHMSGWELHGVRLLPERPWADAGAIQNALGRVALGLLPAHAALMIFFVISGFVLRVSLQYGPTEARAASARFALARIFRIYPIVLASTLLVALLTALGQPGGLAAGAPALDTGTMVANALLLDVSFNTTLWALQVEVLVAPIILLLYFLERAFGTRALAAVAALTTVLSFFDGWALWAPLSHNVFAFLLGMLGPTWGRRLVQGWSPRSATGWAVGSALALVLPLTLFGMYSRWSALIEAYAAFLFVCLAAYRGDGWMARALEGRALRHLGLASGSFYVLHMTVLPIFFSLLARLVPVSWSATAPLAVGTLAIAGCLALFAPVAMAGYLLIEKPGIALGRRPTFRHDNGRIRSRSHGLDLGTALARERMAARNMSELATRREALLAELKRFPDAHARIEQLMDRARRIEPLPDALRADAHLVEGCMAQLWVVPELRDGRCWFRCDSDALVVKSIAHLLCDFYSGVPPAEILATDPSFLREAGITQHLSANRRNALTRVWRIIRGFAAKPAA